MEPLDLPGCYLDYRYGDKNNNFVALFLSIDVNVCMCYSTKKEKEVCGKHCLIGGTKIPSRFLLEEFTVFLQVSACHSLVQLLPLSADFALELTEI